MCGSSAQAREAHTTVQRWNSASSGDEPQRIGPSPNRERETRPLGARRTVVAEQFNTTILVSHRRSLNIDLILLAVPWDPDRRTIPHNKMARHPVKI